MRIGVDFDNTIISYDVVFHRAATERGLIGPEVPANKTAVRDALRRLNREELWTELQGEVYGELMREAEPFPGALEFFRRCRAQRVSVCIISHKTREPFLGRRYDLHAAAQAWLRRQGFYDAADIGLASEDVSFELTKTAKLARIGAAGCDWFIDDLPEFLGEAAFPAGVERILFDPAGVHPASPWRRCRAWSEIADALLTTVAA